MNKLLFVLFFCMHKNWKIKPLWFLVWSKLDNLAHALHGVPELQSAIMVYWIRQNFGYGLSNEIEINRN